MVAPVRTRDTRTMGEEPRSAARYSLKRVFVTHDSLFQEIPAAYTYQISHWYPQVYHTPEFHGPRSVEQKNHQFIATYTQALHGAETYV